MEDLSAEARAAVVAVAGLSRRNEKRDSTDDSPDAAGGGGVKRARVDDSMQVDVQDPPLNGLPVVAAAAAAPVGVQGRELRPYPFFLYKDFSTMEDSDPLTPLTSPGRVPNFPAKMHSILSRPELADIISWLPHGRAWRILKPREFEVRVIPTYFEHAKFSSFIRQANGWGFRRVTQGRDRNAYYHEQFLRALPHLCKDMKRPGVSKKQVADPDHEPDFYKISEMHPVPEKAKDDSILLKFIIEGGPKARMPIYSGSISYSSTKPDFLVPVAGTVSAAASQNLTPRDFASLSSFSNSLGASESQLKAAPQQAPAAAVAAPQPLMVPAASLAGMGQAPALPPAPAGNPMAALAVANQLAFANPGMAPPNMAAALQASTAASQFAAGFAAAAALSQQQFRTMMESFAAGMGAPKSEPPANPPS